MSEQRSGMAAVTEYCEGVLDGTVIVGYLIRRAVERFYHDLEHGHERGLRFDVDAAECVLDFFARGLRLPNKDAPFQLDPWQQWWLAQTFGWLRADGTRRFRTTYLEVARKNGKTALMAGQGLYMLTCDGEDAPEIYSAATKKDQANLSHKAARVMSRRSPLLNKELVVFPKAETRRQVIGSIAYPNSNGMWVPLGRDSNTEDGLNPHAALIDEYHAHKDSGIAQVLQTGMGARSQPLTVYITTAGFDVSGPCYELRQDAVRVLQGFDRGDGTQDDSFLCAVYTLDGYGDVAGDAEPDDPFDPKSWAKANPGLGTIKGSSHLEDAAATARRQPSTRNHFLTKEMNVWTTASVAWLPVTEWRTTESRPVTLESCRGRIAYGGLDLASTRDMTALVALLPDGDGQFDLLARVWVPEWAITNWRECGGSSAYAAWRDAGWLTVTPGNVTDYNIVEQGVREFAEVLDLRTLLFDPWNAGPLVNNLSEDGDLDLQQCRQGFGSLSAPMKELERLVLRRVVNGGGDPVLSYCLENIKAKSDPAGNIKPDRDGSNGKIDAGVATIMAVAGWMNDDSGPVYDGELIIA
ncbi:MAG: terminase TerL endonuclease subunit [Pseudomonadota bacterium]